MRQRELLIGGRCSSAYSGLLKFSAISPQELMRAARALECLREKKEDWNVHKRDIDSYVRTLCTLWPDRTGKNKIEKWRSTFEKEWKDFDDKNKASALSTHLRELKEYLQTELGKLAEPPDP